MHHQVQPMTLYRTTPRVTTMYLRALFKLWGVPIPQPPLGEEPFTNVQLKTPLTQLQDILLNPVIGQNRENISVCHSSSPQKEVVGCNGVSPPG